MDSFVEAGLSVGACLSSPFCNSENIYFEIVGIDVVPYIYIF